MQASFHVRAGAWVVTSWCAHTCAWCLDDYHQAQEINRLQLKLDATKAKLLDLADKPVADVLPGTKDILERERDAAEGMIIQLGPQRLEAGYAKTFRPYSVTQMGRALQGMFAPGQPAPERSTIKAHIEARMDANSVDAAFIRAATAKAKTFSTQDWETDLQQLPKVVEALRNAGHQVHLFTSPPSEVHHPW